MTLAANLSLATVLIGQFAGPVAAAPAPVKRFLFLAPDQLAQQLLGNFASLACLDTRNQIIERNSQAAQQQQWEMEKIRATAEPETK